MQDDSIGAAFVITGMCILGVFVGCVLIIKQFVLLSRCLIKPIY